MPSAVLADRVDLVGHESVGVAVDRGCILSAVRIHEAEDLAARLIHPVAQIADVVPSLGLEVRRVRLGDVAGGDTSLDRGDNNEEPMSAPS
jgi:hypothetical protein